MSDKKYHMNSKEDIKRMLDEAIGVVERLSELLYHYGDDEPPIPGDVVLCWRENDTPILEVAQGRG
jgi:hypothetical protein